MSEYTKKRLESQITEMISIMIMHEEIKNPGLSKFVSISGVSVSPDASHARVMMTSFEDEQSLLRSVKALNSASGFIQSRIARVLKTRNTPKLEFVADTSIRDGMEINTLIDSLQEHDE
jgi:ribosome-binding factor A